MAEASLNMILNITEVGDAIEQKQSLNIFNYCAGIINLFKLKLLGGIS